jgi:hypothetical protein
LVAERDEHLTSRRSITELADAERADALYHATAEQRRRLLVVGRYRTDDERRRAWNASVSIRPAGGEGGNYIE